MIDNIPQKTMESLRRYISHGLPPGHFVTAVLCNDLRGAVTRADDDNAHALIDIVQWVHSHAPIACWGSPQAVQRWQILKRRAEQREEVKG
jgi:hypothetical protein